jgi:hypothetical protein
MCKRTLALRRSGCLLVRLVELTRIVKRRRVNVSSGNGIEPWRFLEPTPFCLDEMMIRQLGSGRGARRFKGWPAKEAI